MSAPPSSSTNAPDISSSSQKEGGGDNGSKPQERKVPVVNHTWEAGGKHIWEGVQEDEQGRIIVSQGDSLSDLIRKRRKRIEQNDYSQRNRRVVRDMIRYVYVVLDASRWMRVKDPVLPPGTRLDVTVQMMKDFVNEYYDQNPLSHLGFVMVKGGEAELLTPLSSSPKTHKLALQSVAQLAASEPPNAGGEFSLQNGLQVAGRSLGHQPRHGSREIVVVTSALSTCDPGSIMQETLPKLKRSGIRVSCFALAAELHICRKLAQETAGTMGVCLDKAHFREWLVGGQSVPPPATKAGDRASNAGGGCEIISMGFPTRTSSEVPSLVHATREKTLMARTAYTCPQCLAKNSELPTDCAVCSLKLVLAPHLARSFHHLFPVSAFIEKPVAANESSSDTGYDAPVPLSSSVPSSTGIVGILVKPTDAKLLVTSKDDSHCCFACLRPLGALTTSSQSVQENSSAKAAELLRFQCPDCENYFCVDCDAYLHTSLHNCPGCLCS